MKTHHTLKGAGTGLAFLLPLAVALLPTSASAQTDLGPTPGAVVKNVSLALKLHSRGELEAFVNGTVSAGSPQFRRFLSVDQFTARYCPSAAEVRTVTQNLQAAGIQVTSVSANRLLLKTTGTVDAYNRYFGR